MSTFENTIDLMPGLLVKLINSPMFKKDEISLGQAVVPQKGIYVFHENGIPIYVGRSNKIKQRISGHCNQSSDRYSATFAFRLAIKEYKNKYNNTTEGRSRKELENDSDFSVLFKESKARVARMGIKVIEIDDPISQTIFEVYAAIKLDTMEFNSFDNH